MENFINHNGGVRIVLCLWEEDLFSVVSFFMVRVYKAKYRVNKRKETIVSTVY